MIGTRLGRYHILACIGEGGMGVVYRARDEHLQREVALKVLPAALLADEAARKRFRREALALSQLNHPNVETVYDFAREAGTDFLVLELIPGTTLDARLAVEGPLPEAEVLRLGVQLAAGLEAAHARGVVHRDLKPANLRVTPDGRLKILDFGLAKLLQPVGGRSVAGTITELQEVTGTLPYMAPEQVSGGAVDARADVYGAGAVLYELATGRRPHPERDPAQLLYQILNGTPAPPSSLEPGVSPELSALILKALEKEPVRRYASAVELQAALEQLRAPGAPAPVAARHRGARRHAWLVPVAGAVGVVLVLAVGLELGGLRQRLLGGAGAGHIRSLAVLPLENLSHDLEQEYFADGMTDELITDLAQVGALRVIARGSVMQYKGGHKPLREVARELRVDALVAGTVLRAGDRVRISAQLVRASTQENLWADSYERDLRDVLALQNDVARAIVERVRLKLKPGEQSRLSAARTVDPQAYQDYLRGRQSWNKYTVAGFLEAQRFFRRAIERDPGYAPAYAGLADAFYGLSSLHLPPNVAIPQARAAATQALKLDEGQAAAHTSLGMVKLVYDWDWDGALREFDRAIALNPGDANAHLWRGHLLVCAGRFDEGLPEIRRALDLDPLNPWISANLGWHLYLARRYQEAATHLENAARLDPDYYIFQMSLGLVREQRGDHAGAVAALERAVAADSNSDALSQLAHAYGTAGRRREAEAVIARLLERRKQGFVPSADLALAYAGLGDREQCLRWLERALDDHSEFLLFAGVDPGLDPVRSDPRFAALLARLGLAPGHR